MVATAAAAVHSVEVVPVLLNTSEHMGQIALHPILVQRMDQVRPRTKTRSRRMHLQLTSGRRTDGHLIEVARVLRI